MFSMFRLRPQFCTKLCEMDNSIFSVLQDNIKWANIRFRFQNWKIIYFVTFQLTYSTKYPFSTFHNNISTLLELKTTA